MIEKSGDYPPLFLVLFVTTRFFPSLSDILGYMLISEKLFAMQEKDSEKRWGYIYEIHLRKLGPL